jgi:hypothetical protein
MNPLGTTIWLTVISLARVPMLIMKPQNRKESAAQPIRTLLEGTELPICISVSFKNQLTNNQ